MYSKLSNETTDLELIKMKIKKKHYRYPFQLREAGDKTKEKSYLKVQLEPPVTEEAMSTTIKTWYQNLLNSLKLYLRCQK